MSEKVTVTDVGPRDGLQNQSLTLSPGQRVELIRALLKSGIRHIEVGSFVSPKVVPAMAGTGLVVAALQAEQAHFSVLVPNLKGYELAREAGVDCVAMVLYATDSMARANANMSRAQAELITQQILQMAAADSIHVLATISVAWACPFDGLVAAETVADITRKCMHWGAQQVVLADTIGAANPQQVRTLSTMLINEHGAERLACHFHDTRALGLANVFAALESGVRSFDASIGGLGGCPFAPGAAGNVATEDVVMMLEQMGYSTGVDLQPLMAASELAGKLTGNAPGGRAKPWLEDHLQTEYKVYTQQ